MFTATQHPTAVLVAALELVAAGSRSTAPAAIEEDEELEGRVPTAIELVPSIEAAFRRESYTPGETATLVVRPEATQIRMQVFRVGPERVRTRGNNEMRGVAVTHESSRPEAGLLGVQYRGNDSGERRGSWIVRDVPASEWLFAGTGVRPGLRFGEDWGVEIDKSSPESPKGVQVIAQIPDLFGPGFTAEMTYYETVCGAKVFAAGAFTLAGQALEPGVSRVLANLWARLARP